MMGREFSREIEVRRDIPYGAGLSLDVYQSFVPTGVGVVYLHGGGWRRGDRTDHADSRLVPLARSGITVISASYRFSDRAVWPAQRHDAAEALRWAVAHSAELGIDPARLGIWGSSAGGFLATALAVGSGRIPADEDEPLPPVRAGVAFFAPSDLSALASDPREDDAALPDFLIGRTPDSVAPEVALVGSADPNALLAASPVGHVTPESAPMLMVHGSRDPVVPLAQPRRMAAALEKAGVHHQLIVIEGATHEDAAFASDAVLGAVAGWLSAT
ncbi:alpha/beta hydrolase [Pseudonocardia dioxanivorans]|jgi:acetyl esterase/lipase|uniref:alpha/beta hydrolase n=1 Tax=Pseudonocardia dioxanivorans TaxID=240495 RepID=UPI000CD14CB0|nr:alpha/beta hydrolase [Pseudonocardia dioxanivorans]